MAKTATSEVEILSPEVIKEIDSKINTSLVRENITDKIICKLKEDYLPLVIKGQEDKEGFSVLVDARKHCKSLRVTASKICKAGRAEANAIAEAWITKEKEVTGAISEVEDILQAREDDYLKEKEAIKERERARIEEQASRRMHDLIKIGVALNGSYWALGGTQYEAALVREADDDIYQDIYKAFYAEYELVEKERLAEQAKKDEEARILKEQQDELTRKQKEFQYQQEAFRVQQEEEQARRDKEVQGRLKKRSEDRIAKLVKAGFEELPREVWTGANRFGVSMVEIRELHDEQFDKFIEESIPVIAEFKERMAKEVEEKRQKDIEKARVEGVGKSRREMLKSINGDAGVSDFELGNIPVEQWEQDYKVAQKLHEKRQKELSDQAEKERQELLGEKQKYEELVNAIKAIPIPLCKSGQYRSKVNIIRDFIDGLK